MNSTNIARMGRRLALAALVLASLAGCSSAPVRKSTEPPSGMTSAPRSPLGESPPAPPAMPAAQPLSFEPAVIPVAHFQPVVEEVLPPPVQPSLPRSPEEIANEGRGLPVTLASVLELMDQENPTVNLARARVVEAYAQLDQARALWLPSIRGGMNYNKHDGRIQDVIGNNLEVSRSALYSGLGANAVGASSPAVPGVYASFHLTDAIFQPRIATQLAAAREAGAQVTSNDFLLQTSIGYLELLRAEQERAVATEIRGLAKQLADVTEAYSRTGQGPESDFDRAKTELALRENEVIRADEAVAVASARLTQVLSLDPETTLVPQEPAVVPIDLVSLDLPVQSLVAQGLTARPEVRESDALVGEAVQRLERERHAPLIPSVLLGVSYGGFGAGTGGQINRFGDRLDADAVAYWELRNLGYGEATARRTARSRIDQARLREVAILDQVAREVVEAHTQALSRRRQIEVAQGAVKVARDSYERNLSRIKNAQGLPLEALQSIQALSQAQREYVRTIIEYNQAQFQLFRAIGWTNFPTEESVH